MSKARDRADRGGTTPIKIGTTILNIDSAQDLTVKDSANVLKKIGVLLLRIIFSCLIFK